MSPCPFPTTITTTPRAPDTPKECPGYDTKQSDGEIPVMLELWEMLGTHSLQSLTGPLWLSVMAPNRDISMGRIDLKCVFMLN